MASRTGKRDSRTKTPPEKKRSKGVVDQPTPPVQEEPESPNNVVLWGEEIQALAIRSEDLEKLHAPRPPQDETSLPATSKLLVRKQHPQEKTKKTHLLVAHPATSDAPLKGLDYSGHAIPHVDAFGQIQPHSILGSLDELKCEALARGNTQLADLITESSPAAFYQSIREKTQEMRRQATPKPDKALENWNYHMRMRKLQMGFLSQQLGTPENELLMNLSDDYRLVQQERTLIDRCIPLVEHGKGYRAGSEFWNQPQYIGDEESGLTVTLTEQQRGFPAPLVHVRKPPCVQMETGAGYPSKRSYFHYSWDRSIYRLQRRHELRPILEDLNFTEPEVDGLEVIGKGRPFTAVSVWNQDLQEEEEEASQDEKENQDPLNVFPDIIPEIIEGPSLMFCGQPARWVGSTSSNRDEIGISARITFEALAGDKATSVLEVSNDGTTAIWYEWRRLPHPLSLPEICLDRRMQRFYFNTNSGVSLPGETKVFPFLFKSQSPGIFSESWEFCTHPVLLGGATLQISLFGIALYEDKTLELRQAVQRDLEARETVAIVEDLLLELLNSVRSPDRPLSPLNAFVTEDELFHTKNPQLYYKEQVVREMHQLWKNHVTVPPAKDVEDSKGIPIGEVVDSKILTTIEVPDLRNLLSTEVRDPNVIPPTSSEPEGLLTIENGEPKSHPILHDRNLNVSHSKEVSNDQYLKSSSNEDITATTTFAAEELREPVTPLEILEEPPTTWNLLFDDFKQAMLSIPDYEEREEVLSHLNKGILELSFPQEETQPEFMYHICLQLWRNVIEAMVGHSIRLRSILGLPEKEPPEEQIHEEVVDPKRALKGVKEEKKGGVWKEEKKSISGREKEDKKDRPTSRKTKGKEEKKSVKITATARESKDLSSTVSLDASGTERKIQQIAPAVQNEYQEKLYTEVYGLLESLVDNLVNLSEGQQEKNIINQETELYCKI